LKFIIAFISINTFFILFSQQGQKVQKIGLLSGVVFDSLSKQPIDYASVRLFSIKDSSVKAGVYTDAKGSIKLDEIPLGKYYIKISFSGYQTKTIQNINFTIDKPNRDLGNISLKKEATLELNEVKVEAKKEMLINSIDKKIYDVDSDISVKGGSANDVLNNVPSVEVDQDGRISLRGDANVTILIDGRPSSLSGGNGKSLLDALPANSIERIEIVTNPSSKYDPDGTSGIINIVLKKNKLKGVNGNVAVSVGSDHVYNGSAALSLRNAKMNLYGTYSYRYYEGYRNYESHLVRELLDTTFTLDQNRSGNDLMINHTSKLGADFYLNDKNTLGISLAGNFGKRERTGDLYNYLLDENNIERRKWLRSSSDPSNNQNFDINLNYKFDFKEDKGNIIFDANQSFGNEDVGGNYNEEYFDLTDPLSQRLFNLEKNNVTTIQADLIRILPKSIKLEAGVKGIIRDSGIDTYSETLDNGLNQYLEDTLSNFIYKYTERIYSAYTNFGQSYKKIKYQLGARFESALQNPNLVSKNENYNNQYYNFFPSAFLTYTINKASEFSFSYSRRINRPNSDNLNPFTSYADPYNLRKGNPALNPEYINSFNIGYSINTKQLNITASVFYRQTRSVITRIKNFYEDGRTAVTYGNIDNSESVGPELVVIYKPFTWMRNMFSANGNLIQYRDNTVGYDWNNSGFFYTIKYAGTFDFWKKTATLQINTQYNAPRITPQGKVQPRAAFDVSANKSLKEGNWNVGFRISDLFNTQEFRLEVTQPGSYQTSRFKQNTRRVYLNVSYKFGKYEMKKTRSSMEQGGGFDF
jgi:outer membrane receptor protein involved in Fe transport